MAVGTATQETEAGRSFDVRSLRNAQGAKDVEKKVSEVSFKEITP